jgi:hypothetical protein
MEPKNFPPIGARVRALNINSMQPIGMNGFVVPCNHPENFAIEWHGDGPKNFTYQYDRLKYNHLLLQVITPLCSICHSSFAMSDDYLCHSCRKTHYG